MVPPTPKSAGPRRTVLALALYAILICVATAGFGPIWRTPIEMANAIDPNALQRSWYDAMAAPTAALLAVAMQSAIYAPIGVLTALSRRTAVTATLLGFDLGVVEQILRWLRPNHVPSVIGPVIAALAALAGWRMVSLISRQPAVNRRGVARFVLRIALLHTVAAIGIGAALFVYSLDTLAMTPSQLATFLALHSNGRQPVVATALQSSVSMLTALDRMNLHADLPPPAWAGADIRRDVPRPPGQLRMVGSIATLRETIADARPGDVIELLAGHYQLDGTIPITQPGSSDNPIVVRAVSLGRVVIDATTVEAFKIYAPHWVFQNLVIRGICANDTACDHAFHIVAGAADSRFRNLRLEDFNAHFKINGEGGGFPDGGRIEYVTLIDNRPRRTDVPVTPIDLDAASDWLMADNFVADFAKAGGDQVSYGGYAKAAGSGNVFERNVVLCEWHLRALPGQRIGLSFGGGGSGAGIRRELGRSGYEQSGSIMRDNLIAACSDDGIYINRSPDSLIVHNTLLDTAGIDVRFPESMATLRANLVDGPIRTRDDGLLWQDSDVSTGIWALFRGSHRLRTTFVDSARLDLRWQGTPPQAVAGGDEPDLCRAQRSPRGLSRPGAFQDFSACLNAQ